MEAASSYFLPRLISFARAMHLVSTGAMYPASHRLFDGLFSEVLERSEDVLTRELEIAKEVTENCSGVSWTLTRDMMWRNPGTAEEMHLLDSRIAYSMFSSKDNKEGVKAFLEKRPVKFTGTMDDDAPSVYPWWTPVDVLERVKTKNQKSSKL